MDSGGGALLRARRPQGHGGGLRAHAGERGAERASRPRTFGTMTVICWPLRDWFVALGVTLVGMESTGVYWKPVFYVLEEAIECWLLNARHLRKVPGRKTDVGDAEWICKLVEHGLVRPRFVPPKEIRELRDLTRYRKAQIEERTREAQRLDKVLQDAGIKLSSVASRHLGQVRARHARGPRRGAPRTQRSSPSWPGASSRAKLPRAAPRPRGPFQHPPRPHRRTDLGQARLLGRGHRDALERDRPGDRPFRR